MFIIQIGACDGKNDGHRGIDEVWELITKNENNRAVLVEPSQYYFPELVINYTPYLNRVKLKNVAIATYNGNIDFYDCPGLIGSSTTKEDLLSRKNYWNGQTKDYDKIEIPCMTLFQLIMKEGIPDYLVIDAEGMDGDIIEDLNTTIFRIPKIRFEFSHINDAQLGRICIKLMKAGYKLTHDRADIIATL